MSLVLVVKWCIIRKFIKKRGGGLADNYYKIEGFLNGFKWFCGEGGGVGFLRVKV